MENLRCEPVGNVDHRRRLQAEVGQLADDVGARLGLQLTLEDALVSGQIRLGRRGRLENNLLTFQYLQAHISATEVTGHHQQIACLGSRARYGLVTIDQSQGRDGDHQTGRRG